MPQLAREMRDAQATIGVQRISRSHLAPRDLPGCHRLWTQSAQCLAPEDQGHLAKKPPWPASTPCHMQTHKSGSGWKGEEVEERQKKMRKGRPCRRKDHAQRGTESTLRLAASMGCTPAPFRQAANARKCRLAPSAFQAIFCMTACTGLRNANGSCLP